MTRTPTAEIDTTLVKKITSDAVDAYARAEREDRLSLLEKVVEQQIKRIDSIEDNLHDGSIEFVKLRHSIEDLTKSMGTIKTIFYWFIATAGLAAFGFSGTLLWFVIQKFAIETAGKPS